MAEKEKQSDPTDFKHKGGRPELAKHELKSVKIEVRCTTAERQALNQQAAAQGSLV